MKKFNRGDVKSIAILIFGNIRGSDLKTVISTQQTLAHANMQLGNNAIGDANIHAIDAINSSIDNMPEYHFAVDETELNGVTYQLVNSGKNLIGKLCDDVAAEDWFQIDELPVENWMPLRKKWPTLEQPYLVFSEIDNE